MHQWLCWYMEDDKMEIDAWKDKKPSEIANNIIGYDKANWFAMENKKSEDVISYNMSM